MDGLSAAAPFNSFWHPVDNLFGFSFSSQSEIKWSWSLYIHSPLSHVLCLVILAPSALIGDASVGVSDRICWSQMQLWSIHFFDHPESIKLLIVWLNKDFSFFGFLWLKCLDLINVIPRILDYIHVVSLSVNVIISSFVLTLDLAFKRCLQDAEF